MDRGRAAAQLAQLREDEPDPVAAFAAARNSATTVSYTAFLCVDEALQVEGIGAIG